jgi:hypothetical protein
LYDYQFSLARTPTELGQRHQAFIQTYNTTAHQGLLRDRRHPPIPVEVLGTARGHGYTPEELARHFAQAVLPRTTNRYGCVTLHSYHASSAGDDRSPLPSLAPRRSAWSSHRLSAWSSRARIASCPRRKGFPRRGSGLTPAAHLVIIFAEERQLQAIARLGVVYDAYDKY